MAVLPGPGGAVIGVDDLALANALDVDIATELRSGKCLDSDQWLAGMSEGNINDAPDRSQAHMVGASCRIVGIGLGHLDFVLLRRIDGITLGLG